MSKLPLKKQHCQGANICLIGANRFQNDLFVANLQGILGCRSTFVVATSLSDVPAEIWNSPEKPVLVYLDCFGMAGDELEAMLASTCQAAPANSFMALYNLDEQAGFEKTALNYGIRGFFYPNDTPDDFCRGTRGILSGQVWLSREKASALLLASPTPRPRFQALPNGADLSAREKEVLALLATGASNEAIATALFISKHTVRTHLYNIYRKIKVNNRMQATLWVKIHLS